MPRKPKIKMTKVEILQDTFYSLFYSFRYEEGGETRGYSLPARVLAPFRRKK